ncbi:MAG: hypothetical protein GY860_18835 [Desulfobacteraceae bacterium]|nr:hypothetical protein [Desulfobacteraceae bacterium]
MITPDRIRQKTMKFWTNQTFLISLVKQEPFFPIFIPAGSVSSKQMIQNFTSVQDKIKTLKKQSKENIGSGFDIVYKKVNHRKLGPQILPEQICIHTELDFLFLIKKQKEIKRFKTGLHMLVENLPELFPLLEKSPMILLKYHDVLAGLISVCKFFKASPNPGKYIRELDIPGVDTKFVETHKQILKQMLDFVLPPFAINKTFEKISGHGFEKRFNLRYDMPLVRFRFLDQDLAKDFKLQDISTTIEEFTSLNPPVEKIFITENKINGLIFPDVPHSLILFGLGYGIQSLKHTEWLRSKQIFYWGDIDTHGFSILSMARHYFPGIRSFLMDKDTLLGFKELWVKESEKKRSSSLLSHLTDDEQNLYQDLVNNIHGERIRLEQERISYKYLKKHLNEI